MDYKDYYKILGVNKTATQDEIKKVYRKLAKQYHPDKNSGDKKAEERFKELNEAYEVLSDPDKRQKYDQLGANYQAYKNSGGAGQDFWEQYGGQRGGGGGQYTYQGDYDDIFGGAGGGGGFSDFFNTIFGSGGFGGGRSQQGRRARNVKGQDYSAEYEITLADAYRGTESILNVDGQRLKVPIKPGVKDGQKLRLKGKGSPGVNGGEAGDLYITLKIKPDNVFERKDDDLYRDLPIDMFTAVLGGKVNVPLLDGSLSISIPKGTQNGKLLRLKGKGMPVYGKHGEHGNLILTVRPQVPENLSAEELALFEQLRKLHDKRTGTHS